MLILFKFFCFLGLIQKIKKERQEKIEKEEEERKEKERQEAEEMVRKIHEDPESLMDNSTATSEQSENKISVDEQEQCSKSEKPIDKETNAIEPKVENGNAIKTENEDMEVDELTEGVDKDGKCDEF